MNQGDHSYCPTIDTQMGRDTCYYEIAILINDQGLCEEIDNDSLKETCYRDM